MTQPHPNDMTVWPEIACQRGHETHQTRQVVISLAGPTGYADLTEIPPELMTEFVMNIWDPAIYPVDGGPYCPAHDAVSETIAALDVWEPRETTLALRVLHTAGEGLFLDIGAQLGWFTLVAASLGVQTLAWEADDENRRVLAESLEANEWRDRAVLYGDRITDQTPALTLEEGTRIRLAKIDLEGAERDALRMLQPAIDAEAIDHLLIEISPVFADYYPDLVVDLIHQGFRAYTLPPKARPAVSLADPESALAGLILAGTDDEIRAEVASWHQQDVWFVRDGAQW